MLSPGDPWKHRHGVVGGVAARTELTWVSKWLPFKLVLFWRRLIYFDFMYT